MINIAVCGYGNLGRAVERNLYKFPDINCVGIFSRREGLVDKEGRNLIPFKNIERFRDKVDVLIVTMGSFGDLPKLSPMLAKSFNIIDSFDRHEKIKEHIEALDKIARESQHTAMTGAGWDPGLFSLARLLGEAVLPKGEGCTFWGKGVSLGHSEAVRRIQRVIDAVEYTIPNEKAEELIRKEGIKSIRKEKLHKRECFVLAEKNADKKKIEAEIKDIPGYFKGYETEVHFVNEKEMQERKQLLSHGGKILRMTEGESMEFKLELSSNADFTASVLTTLCRAVYVMKNMGEFGAKTIFDIRPKWLIMEEGESIKFL